MTIHGAVEGLTCFPYVLMAIPLVVYYVDDVGGLAKGVSFYFISLTSHVASKLVLGHQYKTCLAPHSPTALIPWCPKCL